MPTPLRPVSHASHDALSAAQREVAEAVDARSGADVQVPRRKMNVARIAGSLNAKRRIREALDAAGISHAQAAEVVGYSRERMDLFLAPAEASAQMPTGDVDALLDNFPAFASHFAAALVRDVESKAHAARLSVERALRRRGAESGDVARAVEDLLESGTFSAEQARTAIREIEESIAAEKALMAALVNASRGVGR